MSRSGLAYSQPAAWRTHKEVRHEHGADGENIDQQLVAVSL
jgi:hypothetical protein